MVLAQPTMCTTLHHIHYLLLYAAAGEEPMADSMPAALLETQYKDDHDAVEMLSPEQLAQADAMIRFSLAQAEVCVIQDWKRQLR